MNIGELTYNDFNINEIQSHLTLFCGMSKSGKSLIICDCLYRLKDQIPCIIVICPSESQNKTYC